MGIPAPAGVAATGQPPQGDQANAVISGQITAVGATLPFAFLGPLNLFIWASINTSLATTAGSKTATVGSASGLAIGNAVNSVNVPPGTVITNLVGTTATLSNAATVTGTDANATFTGAAIAWTATVQLERSFDGGSTWIVCNVGAGGTLAQWTAGPISISFGEPERQMLYRLNCISYSSGTINYRLSQTGQATSTLSLPLLA